MFIYEVTHPECGKITVTAQNRMTAVLKAAENWGVKWTDISGRCEIKCTGRAPQAKARGKKA